MTNFEKMRYIGSGATSDVYLHAPDKVIKLFKGAYKLESVNYEARIAESINNSKINAPKYHGVVEINDRIGIVYDFIEGELLFNELISKPFSAIKIIKNLARTQFELNKLVVEGLPSQTERLSFLIKDSNKIPEYQDLIIAELNNISQTTYVCHGDFHVGNIIRTEKELFIIDWMNCYSGNREGDILRSYLMLTSPFIPFAMNRVKKRCFMLYKIFLGKIFLREYLAISGIRRSSLRKWWPIIAAARLADNVPNEEEWLKNKIRKNMKYLTNKDSYRGI
ncbi:MAG: hypothetical protein ACJAT7_003421 [Psychromonas sp.]|jgi:hypothetical protein|uniref:phosphotransferase family protein n=1 Tax=Psychromonas sp. TaxID=1884585 RepID=UPI0039E3C9B3